MLNKMHMRSTLDFFISSAKSYFSKDFFLAITVKPYRRISSRGRVSEGRDYSVSQKEKVGNKALFC